MPTWDATAIAQRILDSFAEYHAGFRDVTRRSARLFESRDWRGAQAAAAERLGLYAEHVAREVEFLGEKLGERAASPGTWTEAKARFSAQTEARVDADVARTFFNSVGRRMLGTVGVRHETEFLGEETVPGAHAPAAEHPTSRTPIEPVDLAPSPVAQLYPSRSPSAGLLHRILADAFPARTFRNLESDAGAAADAIAAGLREVWGDEQMEGVEIVRAPFFRNKGAYLVGRLRRRAGVIPLILPLLHEEDGLRVDAVLASPDEASAVFGLSRSYFHVDVDEPRELVRFLLSVMPRKREDELYTSIGYHKHGKTVLYQLLREHLGRDEARFEVAEGTRGMVMCVFTLPSLNVVFKVIRDRPAPPKRVAPDEVKDRYRLVFFRDRVGRLCDAQEFEGLRFDRRLFAPDVLSELLEASPGSVRLECGRVVIGHLYTERRLTPLDLYLRSALERGDEGAAAAVILDYGQAVKDLAAANIFPGDLLLKNFGVTRHGRVIFYDYDELTLLTECVFRRIPEPRLPEHELAAEPWYHVGERDVFPEEFPPFLAIPPSIRPAFMEAHADLFDPAFWLKMQGLAEAGEVVDFFPYPASRRLDPNRR